MTADREPDEPGEKFHCPACGYPGLGQPAYERLPPPPFPDLGDPPYADRFGWYSHETCCSCGYEFGYDDVANACGTPSSFRDYRRAWVAGGYRWWCSRHPAPPGWSADAQMRAAGLDPAG
ncbi:MAG: hypothetical protein K2X87_31585 [Gemmataceae bacterium]|nr:hypothetical protein [Gemmataceae bacterium]